jgi:hypothetical protein
MPWEPVPPGTGCAQAVTAKVPAIASARATATCFTPRAGTVGDSTVVAAFTILLLLWADTIVHGVMLGRGGEPPVAEG